MTLTVSGLTYARSDTPLFQAWHGTVAAGTCLQIQGANGSGKSTLLRILAGFIEPEIGQIYWQGQPIVEQRDHYQQQLHYIGHHSGIKPQLTVRENLQLQCALAHLTVSTAHLQTIMHRLGLTRLAETECAQLSAGQIRRAAMARLLLKPATLWILDEPTTALDTEGQTVLIDLLNQHLATGGMAIVATHQPLTLAHPVITQTLALENTHG